MICGKEILSQPVIQIISFMFKRIYIICEGETEQEFCSNILSKYFIEKEKQLHCPLIKKTMGGIVNWEHLKKQIEITLKTDTTAFVTTLIDYYGLYSKHNFPNWDKAEGILDKNERMTILENGMVNDIDKRLRNHFIPYIQLHEFEGLLFNEEDYFYKVIPEEELIGIDELKKTFKEFDNPEMINNNPETAPSKRLQRIIKGYNKIVYGNILADEIGIQNIMKKSNRFRNWIERIEKI